ncbi:MAG: DUF1330 domain-containing protein [Actinomycetota bacterium]
MTTNSTLLITLAKPNSEEVEVFHGYVAGSTELAIAAGAEVSSRFAVEHIHGDAPAVVFGLATFPSVEAITTMFDSPSYQDLVPARDKSIECVNAYIVDDTEVTELAEPDGVYLVTVAAPNPQAMEDLAAYQQVVGPISAKHGAQPIANLPIAGHPVGQTPAAFVAIARFPSADAVQAFLNDPDYAPIIPTRDRALASLNLYVTAG